MTKNREGLDKQIGTTLEIYHTYVPTISNFSSQKIENPYLDLFLSGDIVLIFQVVMSLAALLFAYDAIAGDLETGVLRLVLSNPIPRGTILIAKYISALGCLMLPILMTLLMCFLLLLITASSRWGVDDFLRLGGILSVTVFYVSVFYLIGLFISIISRHTSTSLTLCIFVWVFLVIIYPNWSQFTTQTGNDRRSEKLSARRRVSQIWEEKVRVERELLANSPLEGVPPLFNLDVSESYVVSGGTRYKVNCKPEENAEPFIPYVQNFFAVIEPTQARLAEKAAVVQQEVIQNDIKQSVWTERFMKLSPASLYRFTTTAWAGTDRNGILDFIREAQGYRRTIIDYFFNKKAFSSREWFASDKKNADVSDLPRFSFQRADVAKNAIRALPGTLGLLFINLALLSLSFLYFVKIEIE